MEYDEFKRQLGKANLSVRDFADLIKLAPASVSNYSAQGRVPEHLGIVAALIAEMVENRVNYRAVFERLHLTKNRPRGTSAKRRTALFARNAQKETSSKRSLHSR